MNLAIADVSVLADGHRRASTATGDESLLDALLGHVRAAGLAGPALLVVDDVDAPPLRRPRRLPAPAPAVGAGASWSSSRAASTALAENYVGLPVRPALPGGGPVIQGYARCARRRPPTARQPRLPQHPAAGADTGRRCASRPAPTEVTGPGVRRTSGVGPLDARPHPPARRRAGRAAHHRDRPRARRRRPADRPTRSSRSGRPTRPAATATSTTTGRAPLDPNFTGGGRAAHRRRRQLPLRHDPARRLPVEATTTTPGGRPTSTSRCSAGRSRSAS